MDRGLAPSQDEARTRASRAAERQDEMTKMYLVQDGKRRRIELPFEGAKAARCEGEVCPTCKEPLMVAGSGRHPSEDDRAWEAEGYSVCCKVHVGKIRVETGTLFGVREDEAVLNGRCRVY